jgi:hypothetical protein
MAARFFRPKRLLTLALLAVSVAAGIWWAGYVPYDPLAIYRPVPATASLVGRHLALPARWNDLLANPLALALMRTAGIRTEDAAQLVADPDARQWFDKLAGREGTLAYLPARLGGAPAWMAVSHLGGQSQKLRWQLALFRVPGYTRLKIFPGRSVWEVDATGLAAGQHLVIAFGEGVIMACVSESIQVIAEVLGAYDGNGPRLLDREASFARFAGGDDRSVPDRFWIRDESGFASPADPAIMVDVPALRGDRIAVTATAHGTAQVPVDRPAVADLDALARRLGSAPCAVALVQREALLPWLSQPWLRSDARYALRTIAEVASDRVALVLLDGEMGGRLAWGVMRKLGLSGLRVPTVLLATSAPDAAAADAAIQRVLDISNARYRAAFVLRPVPLPGATLHVLESAGGNEWVDELAPSDRPAYAVVDGWLLVASNVAALQKLVESDPAGSSGASGVPVWFSQAARPGAASAWLDLARSGKLARDAIATWSMAQMFQNREDSRASREQLNDIRAWIDALVPLGAGQAELSRRDGATILALDLGLSGADPAE